ncbi:HipA domain-containing protein [Escherichia coli]|nr:HipA domain-containing protein [Escherichia coli]
MPKLVTWMNNQRVGELTKLANGAHTFKYAAEWLASRYARPLSLSLPLQRGNITSDAVFNFFDNLLPDSPIVRDRIVKRYHAKSRQPFDLLSEIGRDSVGAVTLIPEDETVTCPIMAWEKLTEARLEEVLTAYKADIPLGLPQEDMCQTFGLPSSVKYESDGGPGIAQIMAFLMGSSEALKDRYDFMKFQVFQWLIGATDGHAKNFSVFIQAGGSYRLTPFYDIISAFPVLGGTGIHISDLKLAMGLNASKGKKTAIDKIYPRHFLATAKVLKFPEVQMHEILSDFARMIPAALDNVKTSLPTDFPENVVTAVETNVLRLHDRLSREYGIK